MGLKAGFQRATILPWTVLFEKERKIAQTT